MSRRPGAELVRQMYLFVLWFDALVSTDWASLLSRAKLLGHFAMLARDDE